MKKLIGLLLFGILFSQAFSQDYFKMLTEKYADKDGFSASFITRDMFNMYLKKKQLDEKSPVFETLKNLDNILVVSQTSFGKEKSTDVEVLHKEILNHYKSGDGFNLFKTQKTMGEDLKVYLKKVNEKVASLAVISASSLSVNLVELNGVIDMENLSELGRELNLRGLASLYRINSGEIFGRSLGEYYGLGRSTGTSNWASPETSKLTEEQIMQLEKSRELSAEQRKKFEEQAKMMAEKQMQYAEKYREMAEKYQRSPIFLTAPGDTNVVYYLDGKKVGASEVKKLDPDDIVTIDVRKGDEKNKKSTIKIITKKQ